MGVQIDVVYQGELRTQATHGPSRNTLVTDAPVDNCGKGESFSPTDLVATAMGTCILTTMGIFAQRHEVDMAGATATVIKEMSTTPPRRIAKLACEVHLPLAGSHPLREALERAAHTCPVHQSLSAEMEKPIVFHWK